MHTCMREKKQKCIYAYTHISNIRIYMRVWLQARQDRRLAAQTTNPSLRKKSSSRASGSLDKKVAPREVFKKLEKATGVDIDGDGKVRPRARAHTHTSTHTHNLSHTHVYICRLAGRRRKAGSVNSK